MNTETAEHSPIDPLLAAIISQMFADSAATTNALLDSYKHTTDRATASLGLVRARISELLDGPYLPSPDALRAALWPSDAEIEAEIEAGAGDG